MAGPAIDALTAVAGIGRQQLLEQAGAELCHRGADRQLQSSQAFWPGGGSQGARCLLGETLYF